eukprot:CAMPEP_0114149376 /NCGR_PEP_ID=MMETSP0043_2-20121206/22123_1 /TAXON_ID=464988 /ORGANISM="Hemiselmis andersenii, Strain CCMP644" /LENGTH=355 /DNA_ID=CAMNT_0001244009 /DNA_START=95 /DNA_END=1159 /DNA_ORIENTATION=-
MPSCSIRSGQRLQLLLLALGMLAAPSQGFQGMSSGTSYHQAAATSTIASRCFPPRYARPFPKHRTASAYPTRSVALKSAVGGMTMQVKHLDRVTVHYEGRLDDGEVIDSSRKRDQPFTFTVGLAETLIGFEKLTLGMRAGETKQGRIPPQEAYGGRRDELVILVSEQSLPKGVEMVVGAEVTLPNGQVAPVVDVSDDGSFTLDLNHRFAGQHVTYDIEVLDVQEPKTESASGVSLKPLTAEAMEGEISRLSADSRKCLLDHATEDAYQGVTANGYAWDTNKKGVYSVALGGLPVFSSRDKFDHGSGRMSFTAPIDPDHILLRRDNSEGQLRRQVLCARTGAHLGYAYEDGEGGAR